MSEEMEVPTLDFEVFVAFFECFLQQTFHFVLAVTEPASGGGVGGHCVVIFCFLKSLGFT